MPKLQRHVETAFADGPPGVLAADVPDTGHLPWIERRLAKPGSALALVCLVLIALQLPHGASEGEAPFSSALSLWLLAVAAPLLWAETLARLWAARGRYRLREVAGEAALIAVFPPMRLVLHSMGDRNIVWLPRLGWKKADRSLRMRVDRAFSGPMVALALLIVPLLVVEYFFHRFVAGSTTVALVTEVAAICIWISFAIELICKTTIARRPLRHLITHWVDLFIILLPVVALSVQLLSIAYIARLARVSQLARMGTMYRLRGLSTKAARAVLILLVSRRAGQRFIRGRIRALRRQVAEHYRDIEDMLWEIRRLEQELDGPGRSTSASDGPHDRSPWTSGRHPERPAQSQSGLCPEPRDPHAVDAPPQWPRPPAPPNQARPSV